MQKEWRLFLQGRKDLLKQRRFQRMQDGAGVGEEERTKLGDLLLKRET